MTSQDFAFLTAEISDLNQRLTGSARQTTAFFSQFRRFQRSFDDYVRNLRNPTNPTPGNPTPGNPPNPGNNTPSDAIRAANAMAKSMWESSIETINPLIKRAFATGPGLANSVTMDLVKTSAELGVGIDQLLTEVIALREEGFKDLNQSTIKLIARFKLTDQSTQSLIKFMSSNSLTLLQNQRQAQMLTNEIASFAQSMGTRQDDMLNLATTISKSMDTRSALGTGAELTKALTNFGATLGDRGSGLVGAMTQFITSTENVSQLFALGIQDFESAIAAQSNPQAQVQAIREMVTQAAGTIKSLVGDLGTGPMAAKMAESILGPYGGKQALVFLQLAKALEDQKGPLQDTAKSLMNFNTLVESFMSPFKLAAVYLGKVVEHLPKFAPALAGALGALVAVRTAMIGLQAAINLNTKIQRVSGAGGLGGIGKGFLSILGGWPGLILTGVLTLVDYMKGTEENTSELNNKTPAPDKSPEMRSSMLSGYILSQLNAIALSDRRGTIDREMLENSKELVKLAKRTLDISDPQKGLPNIPMRAGR